MSVASEIVPRILKFEDTTFGDKDGMVMHGSIGTFDGAREDWTSYSERLEQYFVRNDVTAAEKKRAILLSVCGAATYQLIQNIVAPEKPTERTFEQLV